MQKSQNKTEKTIVKTLVVTYMAGVIIGVILVKLDMFDWVVDKPSPQRSEAAESAEPGLQRSNFQGLSPKPLELTCPDLFEPKNGVCVPVIKR